LLQVQLDWQIEPFFYTLEKARLQFRRDLSWNQLVNCFLF